MQASPGHQSVVVQNGASQAIFNARPAYVHLGQDVTYQTPAQFNQQPQILMQAPLHQPFSQDGSLQHIPQFNQTQFMDYNTLRPPVLNNQSIILRAPTPAVQLPSHSWMQEQFHTSPPAGHLQAPVVSYNTPVQVQIPHRQTSPGNSAQLNGASYNGQMQGIPLYPSPTHNTLLQQNAAGSVQMVAMDNNVQMGQAQQLKLSPQSTLVHASQLCPTQRHMLPTSSTSVNHPSSHAPGSGSLFPSNGQRLPHTPALSHMCSQQNFESTNSCLNSSHLESRVSTIPTPVITTAPALQSTTHLVTSHKLLPSFGSFAAKSGSNQSMMTSENELIQSLLNRTSHALPQAVMSQTPAVPAVNATSNHHVIPPNHYVTSTPAAQHPVAPLKPASASRKLSELATSKTSNVQAPATNTVTSPQPDFKSSSIAEVVVPFGWRRVLEGDRIVYYR